MVTCALCLFYDTATCFFRCATLQGLEPQKTSACEGQNDCKRHAEALVIPCAATVSPVCFSARAGNLSEATCKLYSTQPERDHLLAFIGRSHILLQTQYRLSLVQEPVELWDSKDVKAWTKEIGLPKACRTALKPVTGKVRSPRLQPVPCSHTCTKLHRCVNACRCSFT